MKAFRIVILCLVGIPLLAFNIGCATERTPTNERLSKRSISSATVGQKPGALERAHTRMVR